MIPTTIEQAKANLNQQQRQHFEFFYLHYRKRLATAYLWLVLVGIFGLHKFYLDKRNGWLYLGLAWTILVPVVLLVIDLFYLPVCVRRYNLQLAQELNYRLTSNSGSDLIWVARKLAHRRRSRWPLISALGIILCVYLPLLAYASLRLTAHHLEIHLITDRLDGSHGDDYIRF